VKALITAAGARPECDAAGGEGATRGPRCLYNSGPMKKALHETTTPHRRVRAAAVVLAAAAGLLAVAGAAMTGFAQGAAPTLNLPIDCVPGKTCWIAKFVDLDPGPGVRDYTCHGRANNGHSGIDIAVRDLRAMDEGVSVLAAAPGKVLRTRDGVEDISARDLGPGMMRSGQCGNGVIIDHGNGWFTQYCHMRDGSIAVKPGQEVTTGQKLGLVGMSGSSEYPHLHFMVLHGRKIIDPFVGLEDRASPDSRCGLGAAPLWNEKALAELKYTPAAIYNVGFAARKPDEKDVDKGRYRDTKFSTFIPVLILWSETFGLEKGDKLRLRLLAPGGQALLDHTVTIPGRKARWWQYVGKRRPGVAWPEGTYRGEITLSRTENGATQSTQRVVEAHLSGIPGDLPEK